jgi:N-acetylmuramoyl-L-alanine amidase
VTPVAPTSIALDAGRFAPGGCIALPPTGLASRGTVLVDAGHGGPDPGSLGTTLDGRTVAEKDLTLPVALAVASRLRAVGVTAVLSRSTDELGSTIDSGEVQNGSLTTAASQEDLVARVRCANTARADALVSVHFNSFDDPAVTGSETLYDVDRPLAPRSRALAQSLQTNIRVGLAALGEPSSDRGVIDDSSGGEAGGGGLVLLGPGVPGSSDEASAMPGALVEPFFLTNPGDLTAVATPRGVDVLAGAISSGVEDYLDGERR